mgnify:CR=1 FL=1
MVRRIGITMRVSTKYFNVKAVNKELLLAALYNATSPTGVDGFIEAKNAPIVLNEYSAETILYKLNRPLPKIDTLYGRNIGVDFNKLDKIDVDFYDDGVGIYNTFDMVVRDLFFNGQVNSPTIKDIRKEAVFLNSQKVLLELTDCPNTLCQIKVLASIYAQLRSVNVDAEELKKFMAMIKDFKASRDAKSKKEAISRAMALIERLSPV